MERELEESEKNFKIIADSAPFALWISGLDKKCFYFNKCWLDFTGKTLDMEVGNQWANGVHPDDLDNCLDIYVSFFNARKPFKMEYRLKRYDGLYRWVLDTGHPRYSPSGEFMGFVGSCIDVTDMWFAHHEMVSYSKQQEELISCSNKLIDFLNDINTINNEKLERNKVLIDTNYSAMMDGKTNFVELILKSCSVSLNSQVSVLFKINPNNRFEMFVDAVVNNVEGDDVIPQNDVITMPRFQLPSDFWDSYNHSNNGDNDAGGSLPYFSILFQKYFTPYLNQYGIRSITASDVSSLSERVCGFVVIGSTIEREYSSIEQNTLIGLANILGVYFTKTEELKIQSIKEKISSTISRNSVNPILTVDKNGTIVDMNPSAVNTLISHSITKASISQLSQLKIFSLFPFLKENNYSESNNIDKNSTSPTTRTTTSATSFFYRALQKNYFLNPDRYSKNEQDKFFETKICPHKQSTIFIPANVLIKEIHFDETLGQTIYLFILKDLSLEKENENLKQQLIKQQEQLENGKNISNCIGDLFNLVKKDSNALSKEQLDLLNNLFKLNNNLEDTSERTKTTTTTTAIGFSLEEMIKDSFSKILKEKKKNVNLYLNLTECSYNDPKEIDQEYLSSHLNKILNYYFDELIGDGSIDISYSNNNNNNNKLYIKIKICNGNNDIVQFKKEVLDQYNNSNNQNITSSPLKDYSPSFDHSNNSLILELKI